MCLGTTNEFERIKDEHVMVEGLMYQLSETVEKKIMIKEI